MTSHGDTENTEKTESPYLRAPVVRDREVCISVNGLAGLAAPGLAVGRARDLNQTTVRAVGAARRIDDDFDWIADLECVLVDPLPRELRGCGAFDHPLFRGAIRIRDFDVKE